MKDWRSKTDSYYKEKDASKIELDKNGKYHGKTPREHIEACRMEMRRVKKRDALLGEELTFWYEYMNAQLLKAYRKDA